MCWRGGFGLDQDVLAGDGLDQDVLAGRVGSGCVGGARRVESGCVGGTGSIRVCWRWGGGGLDGSRCVGKTSWIRMCWLVELDPDVLAGRVGSIFRKINVRKNSTYLFERVGSFVLQSSSGRVSHSPVRGSGSIKVASEPLFSNVN